MSQTVQPQTDTLLAWAGWSARVPAHWRPLDVRGDWREGLMIVGDATESIVQVQWLRGTGKRQRPAETLTRRLRKRLKRRVDRLRQTPDYDTPTGFTSLVWLPSTWASRKNAWAVWMLSANDVPMVLEIDINLGARPENQATLFECVLPTLAAARDDQPSRWMLFGAGFEAPPGLRYRASKLQLGDLSLCFEARDGRRLLLRQTYPGRLALQRRKTPQWLEFTPFKESRRFRAQEVDENWNAPDTDMTGLIRRGFKRFPAPLGWWRPRHSVGAVVLDPRLDRLLLAMYDTPRDEGDAPVIHALRRMNQVVSEGLS